MPTKGRLPTAGRQRAVLRTDYTESLGGSYRLIADATARRSVAYLYVTGTNWMFQTEPRSEERENVSPALPSGAPFSL